MGKKAISRREFIGRTATGLAATGLVTPLLPADTMDVDQSSSPKQMTAEKTVEKSGPHIIYRTLGRTDLKIPLVSFGVMNTESPEVLERALDLGMIHLDTAHVYLRGNSEKVVGRVLKSRNQRDKVVIGTKMYFARDREKKVFLNTDKDGASAATPANLESQLETSLKRLRTDHVDILYLHSCYSPKMAVYEPLMKKLDEVRKAGKARFIGVTTHRNEPEVIRAAVDSGVYDVIQTAYSFIHQRGSEVRKAMAYAAQKNVGIVVMKTQGGVKLDAEKKLSVNHRAALKWALSEESVGTAIPGMTSFEQLEENFAVMTDLALSESETRDLQISALTRAPLYCQSCRACIPTCPRKVELPTMMRAYMYAAGYGNLMEAKRTLAGLPRERGLATCRECSVCTAVCRNGIPVGRRLDHLLEQGVYRS